MKVYSCPDEVAFGEPDFANYDHAKEVAREEEHTERLKAWLIANGAKGPKTGAIVSFPVGDGRALYMLADGPRSYLVHLPYGDGYQYRDVKFLPKAEILRRIKADEAFGDIFAKAKP